MAHGTSFEGFGVGLHRGDSTVSRLIVAAQRGDAASFQELVRSYDAVVMSVALALTGSKDLAQEIYFRVFRDAFASVNKLESTGSVFVWLYRILVKHCIQHCRRNRSAVPACVARSAPLSLAGVLRMLPPRERVIFLLKHSRGLKIRTLAEIFQCCPERIASILQSATSNLRAQLRSSFHQSA